MKSRNKNKPQDPTPWRTFMGSCLVCFLLAIVLFGFSHQRIEPLPINEDPLLFNGKKSYQFMFDLAKKFPNRVTWSANKSRAGHWIKEQLLGMGYQPKTLYFSEGIANKEYTHLENIYVEKLGTTHPEEIIVAMAHYDITDTTVEGAMDDASGVGIVLELARIFASVKTDRTILFLLTDSEEFGAFWGATAFAKNYPKANQIIAAENFDFVSPEKQTKILTLCDGLKSGFTPLWLREIALNSIRSLNQVQAEDLSGLGEFIERALLIPPADHGAMLAAGIPSFNWVGQTEHFSYVMSHYHHTPADRAEAMEVESFTTYGRAAERVIRSIDDLARLPDDYKNSSYWKISDNNYLPGWSAMLLHFLAFIPFLFYTVAKFSPIIQQTPRSKFLHALRDEVKLMSVLLGSLLLGYAVILLLPALHVITFYETFPATQKSLLLYSPNLLVIFSVLISVLGAYWIFHKAFIRNLKSTHAAEVRHSIHAGFLVTVIVAAFLKNSYLASLLLLPPAYCWTFIRSERRVESRALNALLLMGGAITFVALAVVMSTVFYVGVFYWYLFLATAYGLISAYSVVLFFMALTVMIRLFRSFVLYK